MQSSCPAEAAVIWSLMSTGESASKMAHSYGCWQEASVPCHMMIHKAAWLSSQPNSWCLPEGMIKETKRLRGRSQNVVYNLAQERTYHHFCHSLLLHRPITLLQIIGSDYTAINFGRQGSWRALNVPSPRHPWETQICHPRVAKERTREIFLQKYGDC